MRAYTVFIESRTMRSARLAAPSEVAARAMAGVLLRGNDRLVRISDDLADGVSARAPGMAADALARLRAQDFFDWQGQDQCVEDWLLRASDPARRDATNPVLALAGLRVMPDGRVAIGSPSSVPTLHGWFRTTPFDGSALMNVLGSLPGAQRSNLTFAGCHSRAVILPFALVVPAETRVPDGKVSA